MLFVWIQQLWFRLVGVVADAIGALRRVRVVARVQLVPEEVANYVQLRDRLFPDPETCVEQRQTRDAFSMIVAQRPKLGLLPDHGEVIERKKHLLPFSEIITQLEYWGDDPLSPIRGIVARRPKPLPAVEPAMMPQHFIGTGAIIGGKVWAGVSMVAAVFVVLLAALAWLQSAQLRAARADAESARAVAMGWEARAVQSERSMSEHIAARAEAERLAFEERERSGNLMRSQRARLERQAANQEKRRADFGNTTQPLDLDGRLRQLAEPASAAAVPGVPAASGESASPAGVRDEGGATPPPSQ